MRYLTIAIITLGLCLGCGGGGGGGAGNAGGGGGGGGGGGPTGEALVQQILELCGATITGDATQVVDSFLTIFDPAATTTPAFTVTQINGTDVLWELDLDGDGGADLAGAFSFRDDQGQPFAPFDLNQLLAGLANFDQLVAGIPDGTQFQIDIASVDISGGLGMTLAGAVPVDLSGLINLVDGDCGATFEAQGLTVANFAVFGPLQTQVNTGDGSLQGTATLDGSPTVAFNVTLDGGAEEFAFLVNVETGIVTKAP